MGSEEKPFSSQAELMVGLIQQGDPQGEELLYATLARGMRYLAIQKLGVDGDDCFHEVFLALIQRIREGGLREPAALFAYARTILVREIMDRLQKRRKWKMEPDFDLATTNKPDAAPTPEKAYELQCRVQIMHEGLKALRPQEREILVRFYLESQDPETICREMILTPTQYRLLKNRSKQKLEVFTQGYLAQTHPPSRAAGLAQAG